MIGCHNPNDIVISIDEEPLPAGNRMNSLEEPVLSAKKLWKKRFIDC
jgi:hypothetical protein